MGDATPTPRPVPRVAPVSRRAIYVPRPGERDDLAFADGPARPAEPRPGSGSRSGSGATRRTVVLAAVAAAVVLVAALALATRRDGSGSEGPDRATATGAAEVDRGPFETVEQLAAALPLPATFTLLPPDDAPTAPDAAFVVDGDFEAACAALGGALRAVEPSYPELVPVEYGRGGVNRCEASGPVAALHGATVRALVLEAGTGAQLHVEDPTPAPAGP